MNFLEELKLAKEKGAITQEIEETLSNFFFSYKTTIQQNGKNIEELVPLLFTFLKLVIEQLKTPYHFDFYHQAIRTPFDYYQFGLDFLHPLVIFEDSKVLGKENLDRAIQQLANKENVILLANHQTEPDPQAISLLLRKDYPTFAEKIIYVAGHRVTSDPLAVPFSLGTNLLCVYSKKHIEYDFEEKERKLKHNQKTMQVMGELLKTGRKCIFVAPSGGRDRADEKGEVKLAPFDPQSIEMFRLIASKSDIKTHFYPLSLATYPLLPPPNRIQKELGEKRSATCTPIHLALGKEIDMELFSRHEGSDKKEKRQLLAQHIFDLVNDNYKHLKLS